jgi:small-conductance mechanosensitive channel
MDIDLPEWLARVAGLAVLLLAIVIAHAIAVAIVRRLTARTKTTTDDILIARLRWPTLWLLILMALAASAPSLDLPGWWDRLWQRLLGLVAPAILGWVLYALLTAYRDIGEARFDISVADNLRARRRRTRIGILYRIGVILLGLVVFCLMLMSIPSVRNIGVTLIASAGLAGLALGAAAQPALKNLIAGIQMAFTEPIRLDDVVIIENEWGRIEEIRLTYVVVRIWDDRRLIVPVSKFLENSFQNWTRDTSALMGSVFWYLDPAADVARLRAKVEEVVAANPRWDGRFVNCQVTDSKPDGTMELRALMTAKDASTAFDLRCDVREAIYAFVRSDMPEALPRERFMRAPVPDASARS